jgi:hypothetical protein
VVLCVGLPVAVVSVWFTHETIATGNGWSTPDGALEQFVDTFSDDSHDGEMMAARTFVSGRTGPALDARRACQLSRSSAVGISGIWPAMTDAARLSDSGTKAA